MSDRQRYRNQSLHVSGIIEGLEVEVVTDKKEVKIKSGSGIDNQGNLIILKKDINFADFNDITNGELYIKYQEEKQNKQQNDVDESYTRSVEKPLFGFAEKTPDDVIKLIKVIIRCIFNQHYEYTCFKNHLLRRAYCIFCDSFTSSTTL